MLIDVTTGWWVAILVAGVCGAIGGVVHDLLLPRHGDSGLLELASRQSAPSGSRRLIDLGYAASVLIGAVAAVAFLYFLAPEVVATVDSDGRTTETREYDPFKLIAASLIVGSAGAAFLTAMQDKLLKVVAATSLTNLAAAVQSQNEVAEPMTDRGLDDLDTSVTPKAALSSVQNGMEALSRLAAKVSPPS